jgi:hypothetical protein
MAETGLRARVGGWCVSQEVRQGVCRITFKVIQAGAFSLVLAAEHDKSNTREVQGVCLPGEPDPSCFLVDTARLAAEGGWVAGTYQARVPLIPWQRDARHGAARYAEKHAAVAGGAV